MTPDPLIGQQLDEYRLEALLGQGGMARVYRGLDVRLKRYVAIKVIDAPFRGDSDYVVRFEREAQAIAQLEHPHIVRLYRYGEADGLLYMAMQYVEGSDLGTVLLTYEADGEFMEPADVSRIVREAGTALDYAHDKGVVHRDIKPSNIMMSEEGQAILTDFGLALLTEAGTRGEIFGTPQYIAPEQAISSAGAVPQSDLYAIGVILYRMCTGVLPFDAGDPLEVAMQHMTEEPPSPRQIRGEISPEVEAVILRAMAKEPEERYASGAALADALDEAWQAPVQPALGAVTGMTIMERVALNRDELPPIPAAVSPPLSQRGEEEAAASAASTMAEPARGAGSEPAQEQAATEPTPARPWPIPIKAIGAVLAVLLVLGTAFLWLDGGNDGRDGNETTPVAGAVATDAPPSATVAPPPTESIAAADAGTSTTSVGEVTTAVPATATPTPQETTEQGGVATATGPVPTPTGAAETATPVAAAVATTGESQILLPIIMGETEATTISFTDPAPSAPTATAEPAATATTAVSAPPADYQLVIVKDDEILFVVNQSTTDFPLSRLSLVMAGGNGGTLADWSQNMLEENGCVLVLKKENAKERPLPSTCATVVGDPIVFRWKDDFSVHYQGTAVEECDVKKGNCTVSIPAS